MLVVGNLGMSGRREFLLGNVPNRVSHNARCTVVIVNTTGEPKKKRPWSRRGDEASTASPSSPAAI